MPTLIELGYAEVVVTSPYGIVPPLGMEPELVQRLHDGFRTAAHDPQLLSTLARLDMPLEYLGSAD